MRPTISHSLMLLLFRAILLTRGHGYRASLTLAEEEEEER